MIDSQIKNLWDLWPAEAEWLVVGGLALGNEAQAAKERFPHLRCVGFEPCRESWEAQLTGVGVEGEAGSFPGVVVPSALWSNSHETLTLTVPRRGVSAARSSVCRPLGADLEDAEVDHPDAERRAVDSVTLDDAAERWGPFRNAVLWLDVEHAEWEALKGAKRVLDDVLLLNVETFSHTHLGKMVDLLTPLGFHLMRTWNGGRTPGRDALDYVWVRGPRR